MKTRKLLPYPFYDINALQNWLEEMASLGLFLTNVGLWGTVATFKTDNPKQVKYRIEPLPEKKEAHDQAIAIVEEYGWHYVTKYRYFAIYMTEDLHAQELHTDNNLHASIFDYIIKSEIWCLMASLLVLSNIFSRVFKNGFFLTTIEYGLIFILTGSLVILFNLIESLTPICYLFKLKRNIKKEKEVSFRNKPHLFARFYSIFSILSFCLVIVHFGNIFMYEDKEKGRIANSTYQQELPFCSVEDLFNDVSIVENNDHISHNFHPNTLKEKSNMIADSIIDYRENKYVSLADDKTLAVDIKIDYYHLKSDWLALKLANDLYQQDKKNVTFNTGFPTQKLPQEVIYAYHIYEDPTLIIVKEHEVLRVSFSQSTQVLDPSQWANAYVTSLEVK